MEQLSSTYEGLMDEIDSGRARERSLQLQLKHQEACASVRDLEMGAHVQYLTESLSEAADRFAAQEAQHEKDAKGLHTCVNTMQEKLESLGIPSYAITGGPLVGLPPVPFEDRIPPRPLFMDSPQSKLSSGQLLLEILMTGPHYPQWIMHCQRLEFQQEQRQMLQQQKVEQRKMIQMHHEQQVMMQHQQQLREHLQDNQIQQQQKPEGLQVLSGSRKPQDPVIVPTTPERTLSSADAPQLMMLSDADSGSGSDSMTPRVTDEEEDDEEVAEEVEVPPVNNSPIVHPEAVVAPLQWNAIDWSSPMQAKSPPQSEKVEAVHGRKRALKKRCTTHSVARTPMGSARRQPPSPRYPKLATSTASIGTFTIADFIPS